MENVILYRMVVEGLIGKAIGEQILEQSGN